MVRELRDLWFTVYRCSAAIEMPDVIKARDELIHRFVSAALSTGEETTEPTPDSCTFSDGDDELPWYCEPTRQRVRTTRRSATSRDDVPTRSSWTPGTSIQAWVLTSQAWYVRGSRAITVVVEPSAGTSTLANPERR